MKSDMASAFLVSVEEAYLTMMPEDNKSALPDA